MLKKKLKSQKKHSFQQFLVEKLALEKITHKKILQKIHKTFTK